MADSEALRDEIAALHDRLAALERQRPTCPECLDRGWTQGGTPCGCQFSPEQYRRRVVR
jgi:hypothetical protein